MQGRIRHGGVMPNKDRPLINRHAPKNGVGWLMNAQEGKVCSFMNLPSFSFVQVARGGPESPRLFKTQALTARYE